jgi:RimJ/RimL family protein N-acetyltransferase
MGSDKTGHYPMKRRRRDQDSAPTERRICPIQAIEANLLGGCPLCFSSTYDSALRRSAESWQEQAERTTSGRDRATFIAFSDDQPIGIAALYRIEDQVATGEVLQVWVHPNHRGTALAWNLMDSLISWAKENNFHRILAAVTKENPRALKFYTKYGFSLREVPSSMNEGGYYLEMLV